MRWLVLLSLFVALSANAVIESYDFQDEATRKRYHNFIEELRCPKCQNQNIAGSNSPIANDLRRELHRLLEEGRSDDEIVDYMVNRYGDFILYRPRFNAETSVLWLAPVFFLLLGLMVAAIVYRLQRASSARTVSSELDAQEQARLQSLLKNTSKNNGQDNNNV